LKVVVVGHSAVLSGAELALARLLILFEDGPLVDRLRAAGHAVEVAPMRRRARTAGRGSANSGGAAARWAIDVLPFVARLHGPVPMFWSRRPSSLISSARRCHRAFPASGICTTGLRTTTCQLGWCGCFEVWRDSVARWSWPTHGQPLAPFLARGSESFTPG